MRASYTRGKGAEGHSFRCGLEVHDQSMEELHGADSAKRLRDLLFCF